MSALPIIEPAPSDAELIARARAGSDDAFTELYERHAAAAQAAARALTRSKATAEDLVAEGFTRLLSALRNGAGPEVAFRPYLLACVRNAFYDRTRKDSRVDWSDDVEEAVPGDSLALLDPNMDPEERHLIARAFTTLPERWQLVLWHTEVEGRQPADVAPLLGLAPNAVAALAYRAREGLRKAYLQAHLQAQPPEECRFTRERLGAYVRDGVNPREREQIEAHLDHCDDCRAMYLELVDVDSTLRRALIPLVIGVSPAAYLKFIGGGGIVKWVSRSSRNQAAVAAVAVAAVVSGAVLVATASDRDQNNVAAVEASDVERTTTSRAGRGTSTPTLRPSAPSGSTPTLTVPPTVITISRPPTPGRGSSTVAPGATVVPTVTTPPRQTTTTRRPATTSTTRRPNTTTTVRPTTTTTPSTIGNPDNRPPSSTTPGGGGGPAPTPAPPPPSSTSSSTSTTTTTTPPPAPASFVFPTNDNPGFSAPEGEMYAGDTVTLTVPVFNNGGAGVPTVTLNVPSGGTPSSRSLSGFGQGPRVPRAAQAAGCTLNAGSESTYTCPEVPAGQRAVLSFPIEIGDRFSGPVTASATIAGRQSLPISRPIDDPVTSTGIFTPRGDGTGGLLELTITNNANNSRTFDVNPVVFSAPGLLRVSVHNEDPATSAACPDIGVEGGGSFKCDRVDIGPDGTVKLLLDLERDPPAPDFPVTVTVGLRPATPITVLSPQLRALWSGSGTVDLFKPGELPTDHPADVEGIGYVVLVWTGEIEIRGVQPCIAQTLEDLTFHACNLTPGAEGVPEAFDPYKAVITGSGDWRMFVVADRPDRNLRIELYSRVANTPGDGNTLLFDGASTGEPSLGLVGFRRGGRVELSGGGQSCQFPTPFVDEFTATTPAPANPPCPDLGPDIQFTFIGPDAVIPKLFIVQRPG